MGSLRDWAGADKSGIWHKFATDGELIGIYEGFSMELGKFGRNPVYVFNRNGERVKFQSSSKRFAREMDSVPDGAKVKISRTGSGDKTIYHVDPMD